MPELPEVEILVQHLAPRIVGKRIREVEIRDRRSLRQVSPRKFKTATANARFESVCRRGKYLIFNLQKRRQRFPLIGHLGMTGRLFLADDGALPSPHATIVFGLGKGKLIFEDPRRFGGMTLSASVIAHLGPEPLDQAFTADLLRKALARSRQPIKVILLNQSILAGMGNIYASEALFHARLHPGRPANELGGPGIRRLHKSIRQVLRQAIRFGSTLPLDFGGSASGDGLFYYGKTVGDLGNYEERLCVYGREEQPCMNCGCAIRRVVQAGRSTFFCPQCQRDR